MTRKDRLYAMRMAELVEVAEADGIKIDRKGSKAKAVEKILAAEAAREEVVAEETAGVYTVDGQTIEEIEAAAEPEVIAEEKTNKIRKRTKKTFAELVADIPSLGNIQLVPNSKRTAVHVKRGNKRIFGYSGPVVVVNRKEYLTGLEYEAKNYGYVVAPTRENMLAILRNA